MKDNFGSESYFADHKVKFGGDKPRIEPRISEELLFHVSGHATFEQMVSSVLLPLLNGRVKGKHIVLEHGADPDLWKRAFFTHQSVKQLIEEDLISASEYIREHLGLDYPSDITIHTHLPRYRSRQPFSKVAANPLGISGFSLRVDR